MYLLQLPDILVPQWYSRMQRVMPENRKKNIPVIFYDRLLMDSYASLYITVDSRKVGEIMATQMMNVTDSKNWSCILGSEEDYNVPLILDGINSVIFGTDIKINDIFYIQGWSYENSRKYMIDCVRKNKIPETIICGNDLIAQSVIQVLNDSSLRKHIPICGQDADVPSVLLDPILVTKDNIKNVILETGFHSESDIY